MIDSKQLLERIKSRGYWKTVIRPLKYGRERIKSLTECRKLAQESQVALRGWYFPHIGRDEPVARNDSVESTTERGDVKELWRFYQSGQFVHYFGFSEDWEDLENTPLRARGVPPGSILSIFSAVYSVTERYEFAARLAQKVPFPEGIYLEIGLYGTEGRRLVSLDPARSTYGEYLSSIPQIVKGYEIGFDKLIGSTRELALDHVLQIFERFNWNNPPKHVLSDAQTRLLERRL